MGRSILYLFAHQDDELLILPKLINELRAGARVTAVWITDGGKGGNPAKREAESRQVMALVGMPSDRLHFLGFPDTQSARHLKAINAQVQPIADRAAPNEVVSPAYEGGNMDHDVAAFIAAQVRRRVQPQPVQFEYPLYNRYRGHRQIGKLLPNSPKIIHTLPLDVATRGLMERVAPMYRTQRLGLWLLSIGGQKKKLLDRGISYREAIDYDFHHRPVDESCEYEHSWTHPGHFEDWVSAVEAFET